ncbi:putative multidrug transporter [Aureobasidium pullulans]|nr:putative multidrug transporter [Aureobasidium pullulans]
MPTTRASASLSSEKDKDSSRGSPSNQVSESGEKKEATKDHPSNEHGEIEVVDWKGRNDPANPFNWSTSRKWVMILTTCFISILTGLPAGSYSAANDQMSSLWNVQNNPFPNLTWATVSWNMGAALFPLLFVPLTENLASYIIFIIFLFPSAWAHNFATMVVTRFIGGGASSVSINLVGGSISDLYRTEKERSIPMSIFGWTSVVGIALGPFIGGAIQRNLNWRWIYWIQIIFNAGCLPIFWFVLKETRGDVILAKRAKKFRKEGRNAYAKSELNKDNVFEMLKVSFKRPTKMLLTEYTVASFTFFHANYNLALTFEKWGLLFLFQSSITQTFSTNYGFSVFQTSLIQLSLSAGATIATAVNPLQDQLYLRSAGRNKETPGKPIPEARLYFSIPGSLIFTAGLFVYGWTSYTFVPWIAPAVGIAMVGFGIYSIYQAVVNYFTDAYSKYSASALSAASFGRNLFGAFLPLASPQLYSNLGYQWASTLLGLVALVLSLAPVFLLIKGKQIRAKSPFMSESAYDDEDAEERKHGSVAEPVGRAGGNPGPHGQAVPATV